MLVKPSDPAIQPTLARDFLAQVLPFCELASPVLDALSRECRIEFKPKGVKFMSQGETRPKAVHLVQKGGVKIYLAHPENGETLLDQRGEKSFLGVDAVFKGSPVQFCAKTIEDTFFITIPAETFLNLAEAQPVISRYFLRGFSEDYLRRAMDEFRRRADCQAAPAGLFDRSLYLLRPSPPVSLTRGSTLGQAARLMIEEEVGSVLVCEASGQVMGIVTDRDLRRAMALGLSSQAPVETLMSSPLLELDEEDSLFEALSLMLQRGIRHLGVRGADGDLRMISAQDLLIAQGSSPLELIGRVKAQKDFSGLYLVADELVPSLSRLMSDGARSAQLCRFMTIAAEAFISKTLELLHKTLGPAPLPYAWLGLGELGRAELTLSGPLQSALVIADCDDELINRAARVYFEAFCERAIQHLARLGLNPDLSGPSAANPAWRYRLSAWKERLNSWFANPGSANLAETAMFMDLRCISGQAGLARELRSHICRQVPEHSDFLASLTKLALEQGPALAFFKDFVVEPGGEQSEGIDLKQRGSLLVADFARALALGREVAETSTRERLRSLARTQAIEDGLYRELLKAVELLLGLRLSGQLAARQAGRQASDFISPKDMGEVSKRLLKDGFAVLARMQDRLRQESKQG